MRYALNTVAINGWETIYGSGTAEVQVDAEGVPSGMQVGSGEADVIVDAASVYVMGVGGAGVADVRIEAEGVSQSAVRGYAMPAEVVIDAKLAIPRPGAIPADFRPAHPSCVTHVAAQPGSQRVAPERRTHRVAPDARTMHVPPEREA